MKFSVIMIVGLMTAATAGQARAAFITYSTKPTFFGAAGALSLEDFEDEAVVGNPENGGVSFLSFDNFDVASNKNSLKVLDAPFLTFHNTTPGGSKYFNSDTDVGLVGSTILFSFSGAITEFGLTFTRFSQGATLTVNGISHVLPGAGINDEVFFGLIDNTPFTTVQISSSSSHVGMDDVYFSTVGTAVPEPAAIAMWGLGAMGMMCARRKRHQKLLAL